MNIRSRKRTENSTWMIGLVFLLSLMAIRATGESTPEGPISMTVVSSVSNTPDSAASTSAVAGNLTQLNIVGESQTQTWQAYFGNVSGTITLDDNLNRTIFQWNLSRPEGEVYAAIGTVDFSSGNIACYNYSKPGESYLNLSEYETILGLEDDDPDGVNETFITDATYTPFYAGLNQISGSCPNTNLFNATGNSSQAFNELLLYDSSNQLVVYTAILEPSGAVGFNNQTWNFEMLVGEKGRSGDTTATTYYFYVEIE